jgi:hypothetical protein
MKDASFHQIGFGWWSSPCLGQESGCLAEAVVKKISKNDEK